MTEEQLRAERARLEGWRPNIYGETTHSHGSQTTPETTSTTTTETPTKNSSASSYTEYTDAVRQGAVADSDKAMTQQGYEKNDKGEWVKKDNYLSSILNMKKHNEEVERINRAKALNAGLLNAFTTIGDMISAGVGGNVYKRDKNTIAEDAAKDTIARREATIQAEAVAREKDRQDLLKALESAKAAHDKYLELNGIKKTEQTQEGHTETRTSTNSGGTSRSSSFTTKKEKKPTEVMNVMDIDGGATQMAVDSVEAEKYRNTAWSAIKNINLANNAEFARYARNAGYLNGNKWDERSKYVAVNDVNLIKMLPQDVQLMNRELRKNSELYARSVLQAPNEAERSQVISDAYRMIYGNQNTNSVNTPRQRTGAAITPQHFSAYNLLTGGQLTSNNRSQFF